MDVDIADPPSGIEHTLSIDFEGKTYAGNGVIESLDADAQIDSGITQSMSGYFNGTVTVTPKT